MKQSCATLMGRNSGIPFISLFKEETTVNCPRCGAAVLSGAQFCTACGGPMAVQQPPPPASSQDQSYQAPGRQAGPGGINIDPDSRGTGRGCTYEILHQPAFSLAVVQLQPEQSIQA